MSKYYIYIYLVGIGLNVVLPQNDFEDFKKDQLSEYKNYNLAITQKYNEYELMEAKKFEKFKKEVEEKWLEFKSPSKKTFVQYNDDLTARTSVDFEEGEIEVEVIVEEDPVSQRLEDAIEAETIAKKMLILAEDKEKAAKTQLEEAKLLNEQTEASEQTAENKNKEAEEKLKAAEKKNTEAESALEEAQKKLDEIKTNLEELKKQEKALESKEKELEAREKLVQSINDIIQTDADDGDPILLNQVNNPEGEVITPENVIQESAKIVENSEVKKETFKADDGKLRTVYKLKVPLKKNHLSERAKRFSPQIEKNSNRFNLDPALVFAVTETESAFNPKAKSHIPAYGLMQLVPKSGARDAYLYVYKKDTLITGDYLYQPDNNTELGCAYLSKIRNVYFKGIHDDEKAFICSIPAYNTGIGNVSITLSGKPKLKMASEIANNMSTDELYEKLVNELRYKEARNYLKKVWRLKEKYKF